MPGSGPLRNVDESYIHAFKGCALINKFIVVGLLLIAAMPTAALADITGTATATDGDTLEIRGTRYGSTASTPQRAASFASGTARITGMVSRPPPSWMI